MITREEILNLIEKASPSFKEIVNKRDYWFDEQGVMLPYIMLGDFADHIVDSLKNGNIEEFDNIFDLIERLHIEGDDFVKEAATIGILEGIQNISSSDNLDPEKFVKFLKPESKRWWKSLNDFWDGKKPLAD